MQRDQLTRTIAERQAALDQLEEAKQLAAEANSANSFWGPLLGVSAVAPASPAELLCQAGVKRPKGKINTMITFWELVPRATLHSCDYPAEPLKSMRFDSGTACQASEDKSRKGKGGHVLAVSGLLPSARRALDMWRKRAAYCLKPSPSPSRRPSGKGCNGARQSHSLRCISMNPQIDDFRSVFLNWARSGLSRLSMLLCIYCLYFSHATPARAKNTVDSIHPWTKGRWASLSPWRCRECQMSNQSYFVFTRSLPRESSA